MRNLALASAFALATAVIPASATPECVASMGGSTKAKKCCAQSYAQNPPHSMNSTDRREKVAACMRQR